MRPLVLLAALALLPLAAHAQEGPLRQGGPRFGVTYLTPGVVERINEATREGGVGDRIDPSFPVVTQFGWQFEFQTFQTESGVTGVAEVVPLLSGLDRGLLAPSLTFISGLRTPGGVEVGAGPNVSLSPQETADPGPGEDVVGADVRLGLALVAGVNARVYDVSVPVNAAVVLGAGGARVSLLVGLNTSSSRY